MQPGSFSDWLWTELLSTQGCEPAILDMRHIK